LFPGSTETADFWSGWATAGVADVASATLERRKTTATKPWKPLDIALLHPSPKT
jgi:hypothetical protein